MLYLNDYFKNDEYLLNEVNEDIVHLRGIFSIKYSTVNTLAENIFGKGYWKSKNKFLVSFYKNENLLFTKEINGPSSGILIHGDGLNENKTFFTCCENYRLSIYNMNNELIKSINVGGDYFSEFKRVNEKYAIGEGQEGCTYYPFNGLFNLDILFGIEKSEKKRAYDNSRVHFPMSKHENKLLVTPIIARENGFEVEIIKSGEYPWIKNNIVSYDDVFNGVADFYDNSGDFDITEILELNEEQKNNFNDIMVSENPEVFLEINNISV